MASDRLLQYPPAPNFTINGVKGYETRLVYNYYSILDPANCEPFDYMVVARSPEYTDNIFKFVNLPHIPCTNMHTH